MNGKKIQFSDQMRSFIHSEYLNIPVKKMASMIGVGQGVLRRRLKEWGLVIPNEIIDQRKRESRFSKGHVPDNKGKKITEYMSADAIERASKTRFKKGDLPVNTLFDGAIRTRTDHKDRNGRQYKWIRISKANWRPLHTHIWENENGKVPNGHCLWFIDGDSLNVKLSNLEMITRAENIRRNVHQYPPEVKIARTILNKIEKLTTQKNGKE